MYIERNTVITGALVHNVHPPLGLEISRKNTSYNAILSSFLTLEK